MPTIVPRDVDFCDVDAALGLGDGVDVVDVFIVEV